MLGLLTVVYWQCSACDHASVLVVGNWRGDLGVTLLRLDVPGAEHKVLMAGIAVFAASVVLVQGTLFVYR